MAWFNDYEAEAYNNYKAGQDPVLWDYANLNDPSIQLQMEYRLPEITSGTSYILIGTHLMTAQQNGGQHQLAGAILDKQGNRKNTMVCWAGYGSQWFPIDSKPQNEWMFQHTVWCNTGANRMKPCREGAGECLPESQVDVVDGWTSNWNSPNGGDHQCHQSLYCVWVEHEGPRHPKPPTEPPPTEPPPVQPPGADPIIEEILNDLKDPAGYVYPPEAVEKWILLLESLKSGSGS